MLRAELKEVIEPFIEMAFCMALTCNIPESSYSWLDASVTSWFSTVEPSMKFRFP